MFTLARTALAGLAEIDKTYNAVHDGNPNKFCHGFGILQNDIQHFQTDPDFFLEQRWGSFAACLAKAVRELKGALRERGLDDNASLTNFEASTVAITYNTGTYNPSRKLKQGFKSDGKYYGELVFDYISRSQAIQVQPEDQVVGLGSGQEADQTIRQPGTFEVIARGGLRLRGGPGTEFQILDLLGFGDLVSVLAFTGVAGEWAIVDIEGDGTADGCAFAQYLRLLASQPGPAATGEPAGEEAPEDSEGIEEQPT